MKPLPYILAPVCLVLSATADPSPAAEKFLQVEGSEKYYRGTDETRFERADLPEEVTSLLGKQHWKEDGSIPEAFHGYKIDLNKDGSPEYFIETIGGGSGGPAFLVIGQVEGQWKALFDFQGGFHVLKAEEKSWPKVIAISKGGGGNFCKQRFEFEKGVYVEALRENFKDGKVIVKERP